MIIGKGGKAIKQITKQSKAEVKVISKNVKVPYIVLRGSKK